MQKTFYLLMASFLPGIATAHDAALKIMYLADQIEDKDNKIRDQQEEMEAKDAEITRLKVELWEHQVKITQGQHAQRTLKNQIAILEQKLEAAHLKANPLSGKVFQQDLVLGVGPWGRSRVPWSG